MVGKQEKAGWFVKNVSKEPWCGGSGSWVVGWGQVGSHITVSDGMVAEVWGQCVVDPETTRTYPNPSSTQLGGREKTFVLDISLTET